MKNAFAIVSTVFALILSIAVARAQSQSGSPNSQTHIAQVAKQLGLTEAQTTQFQTILGQEYTDLVASMKQERDQNTDVQVAHQNHQKIEDAAMAKLKPVLSDEQYKTYQGIVEAEAYARHHRAPAAAPAT